MPDSNRAQALQAEIEAHRSEFCVNAATEFEGLTTALEVRYVLQVLPLLALFVGSLLSGAFRRGIVGRVAAIAVTGYLVAMGLRSYAYCLLERYHE